MSDEPKHWYLVSYTAHNPFKNDTLHAVQEVALDYPWRPGDMAKVSSMLDEGMLQQGYESYGRPIITGVFYMGEFDA